MCVGVEMWSAVFVSGLLGVAGCGCGGLNLRHNDEARSARVFLVAMHHELQFAHVNVALSFPASCGPVAVSSLL